VERKSDGLGRSWGQAQLGTLHGNARIKDFGEVRELGANEI
jgi:hypothetical protein